MAVYPNTPAARAKLTKDDVILSFDGIDVLDENHLINVVSLSPVGKRVRLTVLRKGERVTVHVDLSDRSVAEEDPAPAAPQQSKGNVDVELMGLSVCPLDSDLALQAGLNASATGVLVTRSRRMHTSLLGQHSRDAAEDVQLQTGDIIQRFAGFPIVSTEELQHRASLRSECGRVLIEILRTQPDGTLHRQVIVWQRPVEPAI